ncbi:hypothetical protein BCR39DRAFT_59132 [Naematelia encephala]|uniref:Uncharacterized protein n=1 Tax=Naematelia encephala TaxID=71784 RepID=A0A1Y2BBM0_9TREE|nr:hypothetical protein BCR39DRAFT_59132 [Naematelia encephala]
MSRLFVSHLRISLFGLSARSLSSTPNPQNATCSRHLIRPPSPAAIRESPTPLVLVRAQGLNYSKGTSAASSEDEEEDWTSWSGMFAEKGYTTLELDITAPASSSSNSPLGAMTNMLASHIRLMAIPFPPVIISSGQSCLLTQAYVEDHPASGLVLINPPPDDDPNPKKNVQGEGEGERGWVWPKFNYEPRFPILVMEEEGVVKAERLTKAAEAGVGRGGKGVSLEALRDGPRGEKSRTQVERWLDRSGF